MVKVLIMSGYGINCERESAHAFELAGAQADIVHINDLISRQKLINDYDIIMFPGGFSYGDDTGSGNAFANKLKNTLWDDLLTFIQDKKLILGVCNGFQIMSRLGLFGGLGKPTVALEANDSNRYECRWVHLRPTNCVFTRGVTQMHVPVAHGEGKFVCSDDVYGELEKNNQIVFRYVREDGSDAQEYPANPNGSLSGVAGICDKSGRMLGMMPHPERAIYSVSEPDYRLKKELAKRKGVTLPSLMENNLLLFKNAVQYCEGT